MQSHANKNSDKITMHNDDPIFKPIIKGLAYFRNWIFATMKPVEIGLKLVFYGSNMFLSS
jgi:hypothetical protein